jgi:hypothetical protein
MRVGELHIRFARAGELAVEFDRVADVDDDQERRPTFAGGESFGIGFGLATGADHGIVPRAGAADGGPFFLADLRPGREERLGGFFGAADHVGTLFGFEDEAAPFVEINAADALGAIAQVEGDVPFEDVCIVGDAGPRGIGLRDVQEVAELREEEGIVGPFRRTVAGGWFTRGVPWPHGRGFLFLGGLTIVDNCVQCSLVRFCSLAMRLTLKKRLRGGSQAMDGYFLMGWRLRASAAVIAALSGRYSAAIACYKPEISRL